MSKLTRNRIIITTSAFLLLIGGGHFVVYGQQEGTSYIQPRDGYIRTILTRLSTSLSKKEKAIDTLFNGSVSTSNLYTTSRLVLESNTLKQVQAPITQLSTKIPGIAPEDLVNITYDNDWGRRQFFKKVFGKKSQADIEKSYLAAIKNIPSCNKFADTQEGGKSTLDQRTCVQNYIKTNSQLFTNQELQIQELSQQMKGEDTFINGSLEDSDFDLIVDINTIGKILFESFEEPGQTLFYKYPTVAGAKASDAGTKSTGMSDTGGGKSTANSGGNPQTNTPSGSGTSSNQTIETTYTAGQAAVYGEPDPTKTNIDPDLQSLTQGKGNTSLTDGNACVSSLATTLPSQAQDKQISKEEADKLLTDALNKLLISPASDPSIYTKIITGTNGQVINGGNPANIISGTILANALQGGGDTSESISCLKGCASLPTSDRLVCEAQCLCTMVSFPKMESGFEAMSDMLRLRFCTVPVQINRASSSKTAMSVEDIITRLKDRLYELVNGGGMVKMKKTKEYLDNPIADFSFKKMISFSINITFRSLFNNLPTKAKTDKNKNELEKLESGLTNKANDASISENKYIVVADVARTLAEKSYSYDLDSFMKQSQITLEDIKKIEVKNQNIQNILTASKNGKTAKMNEIMSSFLFTQQSFWISINQTLNEMNLLVQGMKATIEKGK